MEMIHTHIEKTLAAYGNADAARMLDVIKAQIFLLAVWLIGICGKPRKQLMRFSTRYGKRNPLLEKKADLLDTHGWLKN